MELMLNFSLKNLKGDIPGGVTSAITSLPSSLAYGLVAFSPLGAEYAGFGIQAGLYSAIVAGFFTAVFGGTRIMVSGPKAPETVIFASTLTQLLAVSSSTGTTEEVIFLAITSCFLMVVLAGFMQILLGVFGIGRLTKFIPYPVIAGFMNGSAILIMKSQVWDFTGIQRDESFLLFLKNLSRLQPLTVTIAFITLLTMLFSSRFTQKIPGSILGLATGTILYQILISTGFHQHLSTTIEAIPIRAPTPDYLIHFIDLFRREALWSSIVTLLPGAFGIAILGTITALLSSHVISEISGTRADSNRELIGQGIGKIASALFGGIPATGTLSRSLANFNAGGRTRLSVLITSISLLLIILVLSPVMALIPKAAIAGVLFALAINAFDKQSFTLLLSALKKDEVKLSTHLVDLLIILSVTLVTVFLNLVTAVGFGVGISILIFIVKMSKSIIRKIHFGSSIRSKKTRNREMIETLIKYGNQIAIIELEGSLFFGSADVLSSKIDELARNDVKYFILDMKRISDIDSTGSNILARLYHTQNSNGLRLAISYVKSQGKIWSFLKETTDLLDSSDNHGVFAETDLALECFEDLILNEILITDNKNNEISMEKFPFTQDLNNEEIEILFACLKRFEFKKGDLVFSQGDNSNTLYFITKGSVDITINIDDKGNKIRVSTIPTGTFFGEIALLDNTPRSANVEACEDLITYVLTREDFEILKTTHANISIALLTNISQLFAARLRAANRMISELEK